MIEIMFTGPCVWNPKVIGWADATIGYTGEHPVATAERYIRQYGFGHKLALVMCNGRTWLDHRP